MGICESAASMSRLDAFALRAWRLHLAESLQNLRAMGQRSWLALLGIVVGSASVVALLDIGRSASEDAISTFKGMGTDALVASFPEFPRRIPPCRKSSIPAAYNRPCLIWRRLHPSASTRHASVAQALGSMRLSSAPPLHWPRSWM